MPFLRSLVPYQNPDRSVFEQAASQLIAAKRSKHTKAAYSADLERWVRFCYAHGADPATALLPVATAFRDHLTATLSDASTRRVLSALSFLYRGLLSQRVVVANIFHPSVLAWPPAPSGGKTPAVSDADAEAILAATAADNSARGARDLAILRLLYDLGLRRESVAGLIRAGIRVENGRTLIRVKVKGGREEDVPLPALTAAALTAWLTVAPEVPYAFPGKGGGAINTTTVNKIVKARSAAVGIQDMHPHRFRASFVTSAFDAGLPEREIQGAVHHADPKTTRSYDRGARGGAVPDAVAEHRRKR